jgi:hypothetical protein
MLPRRSTRSTSSTLSPGPLTPSSSSSSSSNSLGSQAARASPTPPVFVFSANTAVPDTRQSTGADITANMSGLRLGTTPPPDDPSSGLDTFQAMTTAIEEASQRNLLRSPPETTPDQPSGSASVPAPEPTAATPSPGEQHQDSLSPPSGHRRRRSSSRVNLPPYDVQDEVPPKDRFHDPAFQTAFRDAKEVVADLRVALSSSALHVEEGSTIRRLDEMARSLYQFRCPSTRVVGFVGDSGAGKFQLLPLLILKRMS